jgi:hypothetical protein
MALILRASIPRALMIITPQHKAPIPIHAFETYCAHILITDEHKPYINTGNTGNTAKINTPSNINQITYTTCNIHDLVEQMHINYKQECCNECGSC